MLNVVMPQWKLFLVQLLNIAGRGPIFGALGGAQWGAIVFLWITFGTIFAGGVHDYFSGMMSARHDGASIAEVCGIYLGSLMQNIMRVFSMVLLVMVGTVFAVGPAGLMNVLMGNMGMTNFLSSQLFWLILFLIYYFIATFISIDKIIGQVYPLFGICLIIMAVGVIFGIMTNPAYTIPEIWDNFHNMHSAGTPIWSVMFITVACGAISGFHPTQSLLMARCLKSEKQGHFVFYGAMVAEGVIALVWAAAGVSLYEVTGGFTTGLAAIYAQGQSVAIYDVCQKTMGGIGIALAMIVLWTASMYLYRDKKNYWLAAVPVTFMSAVSMTYFFYASECLNLGTAIAYPVGIILAIVFLAIFIHATRKPASQIS